ncbi:MAG: hypothetical protein GY828_04060 [Candidatus Gracilibacteria bacterium]|nr:hypothetical protein [Candidatus Gracilibacteria bacterium]
MKKLKKFLIKETIILLSLTFVFTGIVFIGKSYFFANENFYIEEHFIEPSIDTSLQSPGAIGETEGINIISPNISEKLQKYYLSELPYHFEYIPENIEEKLGDKEQIFTNIITSDHTEKMVDKLRIELYEDFFDVRGKMKNKAIQLFGILDMPNKEFVSVGIHEFAHFIDIYFLEKKVLQDISVHFYDISWEETKVMKAGQSQDDFVSGYSMTNKYEDFAESFTYYILHNEDFLEKAKQSKKLQQKYDFFGVFLFKKGEFQNTDFSVGNTINDYYWDITKIEIEVENLLQYLQKGI